MTDYTEADVRIAVTSALMGMLENDILHGYGIETFKGWCEDGDMFYDMYEDMYGEQFCKDCIDLMNKITDKVDDITYQYLAVDNL